MKRFLRRKNFLILGIAALAWVSVAQLAARFLVVRYEMKNADAIVVLSGSSNYEERRGHAANLFFSRVAPEIILTTDNTPAGWDPQRQRNPLFIERAVEELCSAGIPREKIIVLPQEVSSTHDEALLLSDYALKNGIRSLLVVTSPYHSRRSYWVFRRAFQETGIEIGIDTEKAGIHSPGYSTWWLTPAGWRTVGAEYPKMIYYWLFY